MITKQKIFIEFNYKGKKCNSLQVYLCLQAIVFCQVFLNGVVSAKCLFFLVNLRAWRSETNILVTIYSPWVLNFDIVSI